MNQEEVFDISDGYTGMFASELADAFWQDNGREDRQEEEETRMIIILAAETLAEIAGPGRWGGFDAAEHFRRIDFVPRQERVQAGLVLMGLFGWLFFQGYLDELSCLRIIAEIRSAAPRNKALEMFFKSATRGIEHLAAVVAREAN